MVSSILTWFKSLPTSSKPTTASKPTMPPPWDCRGSGLSLTEISAIRRMVEDLPGSWTITESDSRAACGGKCECEGKDVTVSYVFEADHSGRSIEFTIWCTWDGFEVGVIWADGRTYSNAFWDLPTAFAVMRAAISETVTADMSVTA